MRTLNISPLTVDELFSALKRERRAELLHAMWRGWRQVRAVLAACACLRRPRQRRPLQIACE